MVFSFGSYVNIDTYELERLLEEMETPTMEEVQNAIREIDEAISKLESIKQKIISRYKAPTPETRLLRWVEKTVIEEEIPPEYPDKLKYLSAYELATLALAYKPNAPERVKKEAQEIMFKYGLTVEDMKRAYEIVYGR